MNLHHTGVPAPFFTCHASLCFWLCSHHRVLPCLCSPKCVDTISGSRPFGVKQDVPAESSQGTPGGCLVSSGIDRKSPECAARASPPLPPGAFHPWPASPAPSCLLSGHPRTQCQPRTAQLCLQLCALMQITQPLCASLATSREREQAQHLLPGVGVRAQDTQHRTRWHPEVLEDWPW